MLRNVRDEFKALPTAEIKRIVSEKTLPFSVATLSITGDLNVGAIIRSAHLFGARNVHVIGRRKIDSRSIVGMANYIDVFKYEGRTADLMEIDPQLVEEVFLTNKLVPIVVELGGTPLPNMDWPAAIPGDGQTLCLTFGNEGLGISEAVLDRLRAIKGCQIVSIPQRGAGRSHNVANAASIVMGHMVNQMGWWDK